MSTPATLQAQLEPETMFKNYLTIALRNLRKHRGFAFINIAGLALGLACCLLIALYVRNELSCDRFHEKANRIYRVTAELQSPTRPQMSLAPTPPALAEALQKDVPGIEAVVRLRAYSLFVKYEDQQFQEDNFLFADSDFCKIFTFPLSAGNPQQALREPFSVILSDASARKYFGERDPLGQTLVVEDTLQFQVTGVFAPLPANSHLQFDFIASFASLRHSALAWEFPWWSFDLYTYILLAESAAVDKVAAQIRKVAEPYIAAEEKENGMQQQYFLQPLQDIYLHSHLAHDVPRLGDVRYVYSFSAIALLILLIACMNFINLATARASQRAQEVGARKTLGAQRRQLLLQFLAEALVLAMLAMIVAVVAVAAILPEFNAFAQRDLHLDLLHDRQLAFALLGLTLLVGLIAGSYPALSFSRLPALAAFRQRRSTGTHAARLRGGLVVFQFAISVALIAGTLIVFRQLRYMQQSKLGFTPDQILVLPVQSVPNFSQRYQAFLQKFRRDPAVLAASASSAVPGKTVGEIVYLPEGFNSNETQGIKTLSVDYDFVKTYGMEIVAGRDFSPAFSTDAQAGFVINEAAVADLGWGQPAAAIGKKIVWGWPGKAGQVIGVVKDFHQVALREKIVPMLMHIQPGWFEYLSLKISTQDLQHTRARLERAWQDLVPNRPYEFYFMDEFYNRQYHAEERVGRLFAIFSMLAVGIACLGLFSLAAFTLEQRTKEISVRKVLGATVPNLVALLSRDFSKWVVLANLIAWPVAYTAMHKWLQDFAYHVAIEGWVFALAGGLALLIAMLTVSAQALRAACENPVAALRQE